MEIDPCAPDIAGATLLSCVAYPFDMAERQSAYLAILSHRYRTLAADPVWAQSPQLMDPRVFLVDAHDSDAEFVRLQRLINRNRQIALRVAFGQLSASPGFLSLVGAMDVATSEQLKHHGMSLSAAIERVAEDVGRTYSYQLTKNAFFRDIWPASRPVLHLVAALYAAATLYPETSAVRHHRKGQSRSEGALDTYLLSQPAMIGLVVSLASDFRHVMAETAGLNIRFEEMVDVQLATPLACSWPPRTRS
jgi:hypothetical protein